MAAVDGGESRKRRGSPPAETVESVREQSAAKSGHEPDARLRRFGFKILSRPRVGPVLWVRDGKEYTEADAHAFVSRQMKKVESGLGDQSCDD